MGMNTTVDGYLSDGCGRCPLGGTPDCKVHNWQSELRQLRMILLDCGLTEEVKWGVPCYTYKHTNIVVLSALIDSITLGFFKGVLLSDKHGLLEKPGENTQAARLIRFTDLQSVISRDTIIRAYLFEAIEVEKAGLKVDFKEKDQLVYPEELQRKLDEDPVFRAAFEALTPGRQRGYNLFFSAPKQSKTRESRIETCVPKIMEGRGLNDR